MAAILSRSQYVKNYSEVVTYRSYSCLSQGRKWIDTGIIIH